VFVSLPPGRPVPPDLEPLMMFREEEGTTLIIERSRAAAAALEGQFPCRMISLAIHSALDAVGFLAAIAAALAARGLPSNAVSAYHHDHLFVPEARAAEAMDILHALSAAAARGAPSEETR
jgi:hypothetical protein